MAARLFSVIANEHGGNGIYSQRKVCLLSHDHSSHKLQHGEGPKETLLVVIMLRPAKGDYGTFDRSDVRMSERHIISHPSNQMLEVL